MADMHALIKSVTTFQRGSSTSNVQLLGTGDKQQLLQQAQQIAQEEIAEMVADDLEDQGELDPEDRDEKLQELLQLPLRQLAQLNDETMVQFDDRDGSGIGFHLPLDESQLHIRFAVVPLQQH